MRFHFSRFQLAVRCFTVSAATFSMLLGSSLEAAQVSSSYNATPFGGYGSLAARPAQNYATSRPAQSDSTGSNYQSMSPDSWGSSAPGSGDPFSSSVPASALNNPAMAGYGPPAQSQVNSQNPYAQTPGRYSPAQGYAQPYANQSAPGNQYESTGAPSMQTLLGNDRARESAQPDRIAPPSPFRPAEYDLQDPRDIPLAPTIPSSILDENNNRLDRTQQGAVDQVLPPSAGIAAPQERLSLDAPAELQNQTDIVSKSTLSEQSLPRTNEAPLNQLQSPVPQAAEVESNSFQPSESNPFPQTPAQPFVPGTAGPMTPYQMPQVFETVPGNAPMMAPSTAPPTNDPAGFGWGNAPGVFQRGAQPNEIIQTQPARQAQPARKGPRFPLPFGLNSKGFGTKGIGKGFGKRKSQLDLAKPDQGHARNRKAIDPNTYPPQPVAHSHPVYIPTAMPNGQYRPDLAQRSPLPTVRNPGTYDSGHEEYDFEKKKTQYPPFSEILATGRWFGAIEGQFLKPRFNGNSGITILDQSGGFDSTDSQVFDFDSEFIPNLRFGFESKYGPGFEVDYRTLRTASIVQSFTSGASSSGSLNAALPDSSLSSQIATTAAGQTISGAHTFNLKSYGFSVFKEVQLPITRINGVFGFQAAEIDHQVDATVDDGAGTILQSLNTRSNMRAFGPRIRLEYYRPVGHTPFEFITQVGGSLMFGKRDQFIRGPGPDLLQRVGTDEIINTLEFLTALQVKQRIGENRSVYGRLGFMNQTFNSGGSGFLAQDDFGLRGFTFMVGVNR